MESISSPFSRWKRHRVGLFSTGFFLSCVTPKRARRGGNSYNFISMKPLKTFYILLWRSRRTKRFRLFVRDHLHVPCTSMVIIMFYTDFRFFWRNTLVFQQKVNGKSKTLPGRNNYSQSIGEATFLLGRLIKPLGRVSMVMLQRGVRIFVFLLVSCKQVSL